MKPYRFFCFLLCFALLLSGCRKNEAAETEAAPDTNGLRTHVYNETRLPLPEGAFLKTAVTPLWDAETGELTCVVSVTDYPDDPDEEPTTDTFLVVTGGEGVVRQTRLELPADQWILAGMLDEDGLFCLLRKAAATEFDVIRFDRDGKEVRREERVETFFGGTGTFVYGAAEFGDGGLALLSADEVLTLRSDGSVFSREKILQNRYEDFPPSFARSGDGTLLVVTQEMESVWFSELGEDGRLGEACGQSAWQCAFGPEFAVYARDTTGVWGVNYTESGAQDRQLLLGAADSGLKRNAGLWAAAGDALFFTTLEDNLLVPLLYTPGEDVDVSGAVVLHIATSFSELYFKQEEALYEYNRTHTDFQFVIDSYANYPPENGQPGGQYKLARDLVAGVAKPDILICETDSAVAEQAYRHGLYRDLMPYLESDERVNRDSLFSSVLRMFDDGNGGFWGLSPSFRVRTLVMKTENAGPFAERGYWTLSEMLDYIEALPDGVTFMKELRQGGTLWFGTNWQGGAAEELLYAGDAYLSFIDGTSCSFDSPEFLRFLRWLESLPDEKTYQAHSPYADMDPLERNTPYVTGEIRAASRSFVSWETYSQTAGLFLSKNWTPVGFPAPLEREGAGNRVSAFSCMIITKDCAYPDAAWELIRSFFVTDDENVLPSLKTDFRTVMESYYDTTALWYNSYGGWITYLKQYAPTEEDMERPGIIVDMTPEDTAKLEAIIESAGIPLRMTYLSTELKEIIHEEISFFLGGVGTAEDCAAKIQSRVSILLAENG